METKKYQQNSSMKKAIGMLLCIILMFTCLPVNMRSKLHFEMQTHAAGSASTLVNFALSQVGAQERSKGSDDIIYNDWYYGRRVRNQYSGQYAWCHAFVSYCAEKSGCASVIPKTASCAAGVSWFKSRNQYHTRGSGYQPKVGDIVYFSTDGTQTAHHVGIVYAVNGANICYVDGNNTSHNPHWVARSQKSKNHASILGYGSPNYSGGSSGTIQPANPELVKPTIDNVKIDSIDSHHITVSFTANNSGLAKVNVTSISTGETKEQSFTSGLSRITYTFDTREMSNAGKDLFVRIYAYRTPTEGEDALYAVHAVTYGPNRGQVLLPDKEMIYNIESLPSNLVTTANIRGWVIGEKISRVTMVINDVEYECSRCDRGDVSQAFPDYSSAQAGFNLEINALMSVRHGSNDLVIRAYTSDVDYVEIYKGTFTATKLDESYFDWSWYYARYCSIDSEIASIGPNPDRLIEHYYTIGLKKGYCPNICFNSAFYLAKNPDIASVVGQSNIGAYNHFVNYVFYGNELRETSPFLDLRIYKAHNADLAGMTAEGLFRHYYLYGSRLESRIASYSDQAKAFAKAYSSSSYARLNEDISNVAGDGKDYESAQKLWHHFMVYTLAGNENRIIKDTFDLGYYKSKYGIQSSAAAFWRYIDSGYAKNEQTVQPAAPTVNTVLVVKPISVGTPEQTKAPAAAIKTAQPIATPKPTATAQPITMISPIVTVQPNSTRQPKATIMPAAESSKPEETVSPLTETEKPKESPAPETTNPNLSTETDSTIIEIDTNQIDLTAVTVILKIVLGIQESPAGATLDLDNNGTMDLQDVQLLLRIALGII